MSTTEKSGPECFGGDEYGMSREESQRVYETARAAAAQPAPHIYSADVLARMVAPDLAPSVEALTARADAAEAECARLRRMVETATPWQVSDPPTDEEMHALRMRWAFGPERYQADADSLIAAVMHGRSERAKITTRADELSAECVKLRAAWVSESHRSDDATARADAAESALAAAHARIADLERLAAGPRNAEPVDDGLARSFAPETLPLCECEHEHGWDADGREEVR